MKLALVTTPPSLASGIGDYTRQLAAQLAHHAEIHGFVEHGRQGETLEGRAQRSVAELDPREFDQIVYQLGNEIAHAFMGPVIRRCGGTLVLHDWVLFDLALAAHPSLARGGPKGFALALREGGFEQARVFLENTLEKRRARRASRRASESPVGGEDPAGGTLLDGWHGLEPGGRWTSERARVRLPGRGILEARVECTTEPGREVSLSSGARRSSQRALETKRDLAVQLDLEGLDDPILSIEASPVFVSDDQRRHGDTRRLGAFVRRIVLRDGAGTREISLAEAPSVPLTGVDLSRDRFRLPFNRSIVAAADSCIVHSRFMRERVLGARGPEFPSAVVHHGAEARWLTEDRRAIRARLGLSPEWQTSVLLTSFGHVQEHKRIEPLLNAFAHARRERPDLRLSLIGAEHRDSFDARRPVRELGLEPYVLFTGRVREEEAWPWIHAGDFAVQLRGPSTGGTSGGVFQSLGLGRAVIASDLDEQRELPETCVARVPPGEGEVEHLARLILALAADAARRERMEAAARDFVSRECSWTAVAARYAECLAAFPRPRGGRSSARARRGS